jgi:hypothetical protein
MLGSVRNASGKFCRETEHTFYVQWSATFLFCENRSDYYKVMCGNVVEPDRQQIVDMARAQCVLDT